MSEWVSLPETNISSLRIDRIPKVVSQPSIFRCHVSFRGVVSITCRNRGHQETFISVRIPFDFYLSLLLGESKNSQAGDPRSPKLRMGAWNPHTMRFVSVIRHPNDHPLTFGEPVSIGFSGSIRKVCHKIPVFLLPTWYNFKSLGATYNPEGHGELTPS